MMGRIPFVVWWLASVLLWAAAVVYIVAFIMDLGKVRDWIPLMDVVMWWPELLMKLFPGDQGTKGGLAVLFLLVLPALLILGLLSALAQFTVLPLIAVLRGKGFYPPWQSSP